MPPATRPLRVELANLEERVAVLTEKFPTMVMDQSAKPRETYILARGDYSQPTDKVTAGTPAVLPPPPDGAPANRLGLAEWVTMPEQSAHGARGGESRLADAVWGRDRADDGRLRRAGRVAEPSGIARLAGRRFHETAVGTSKALVRKIVHVGDVSAERRRRATSCSRAIRAIGCWRAGRGSGCRPSSFATRR